MVNAAYFSGKTRQRIPSESSTTKKIGSHLIESTKKNSFGLGPGQAIA